MSKNSRGIRKTTAEILMDWFEANPASHVRSGPLAKALKMTPTTISDALAKLAIEGRLHREKKTVAGEERAGARAEQWEYSLPCISAIAQRREPKPFKPLKTTTAFRRETAIEAAPSIIVPAVRQPQPEVGQNTGSLGSDRPLSPTSLPEAQAVNLPPIPDETPVEAGGDVTELRERAELAERNFASLLASLQQFCDWVNTEFTTGNRYPINLEECSQALATWRNDLLDDLESSRAQARQYIASDEACGQIHRICHDAGMPEGNVVDRVEGLAARIAMLEANASLPFESAPAAPVATVKESLTAQYAIAVDEDLYSTPEAAIAAIAHVHDLHDNEVVRNLTIVAVNPVGKISLVPTMVPIFEAA